MRKRACGSEEANRNFRHEEFHSEYSHNARKAKMKRPPEKLDEEKSDDAMSGWYFVGESRFLFFAVRPKSMVGQIRVSKIKEK